MKRLTKIVTSIFALIMLLCCFCFTGCKQITGLDLYISVYDSDTVETKVLSVDLYGHLAPETVDSVVKKAKEGLFDGAIFYQRPSYSSQIMFGDLKYDSESGKIVQITAQNTVEGEFEANGVQGSNLTNAEGYLGLWRSWYQNGSYTTSDDSRDSGRNTMYMPTSAMPSYDGYFCVFGKFNLSDSTVTETWEALKAAITTSDTTYYVNYTVYYTGDYVDDDSVINNGLTFNCVKTSEFNADSITDLFSAEAGQLSCYNYYEIKVPYSSSLGFLSILDNVVVK